MRHRVAYCEVPKLAGVYTFAVNLADPLAERGYDLHLVGVGPQARVDYARGLSVIPAQVLAPDATDAEAQRDALVRWLESESIDLVMISGSEAEQRLIPALPARVRVISVVNNATHGHYRIATAHHERMHRLVCVSPRLVRDLIRTYRVPAEKVQLIPYGIDTGPYVRNTLRNPVCDATAPLRLLYLGRMCDSAKGIFWIPKICSKLNRLGIAYHLTVLGDGPDRSRFSARMEAAGCGGQWTYLGAIRYDAVPAELVRHDVLLLPSRHEGLPLTLLEGMAAGCVPVASRLAGITDYVIHDGEHGILCRVGRIDDFVSAVAGIAQDRARLARMSAAAAARIRARFTRRRMATQYADLFDVVLKEGPGMVRIPGTRVPRRAPLGAGRTSSWRRFIPARIKNTVRTVSERVGWTV